MEKHYLSASQRTGMYIILAAMIVYIAVGCTKVPIERPDLVGRWCKENPQDCFTPDELPATRTFASAEEVDKLLEDMCAKNPDLCTEYKLVPVGRPVRLLGIDTNHDICTTNPELCQQADGNPIYGGVEPGPTPNPPDNGGDEPGKPDEPDTPDEPDNPDNPDKPGCDKPDGGRHDHGKGDHSAGRGHGHDQGDHDGRGDHGHGRGHGK